MSNLLLANTILPEGFINAAIGEPHMVRDNFINIFQIEKELKVGQINQQELIYPAPVGYEPLVKLLEARHGHPVIITNGAKQALGACFYAIKKLGWNTCSMKSPYWALIPPLATMHGVHSSFVQQPDTKDNNPFLLLAPNNPDGQCETAEQLLELEQQYKHADLPFIHDAAYYTHIYLSQEHSLPAVGDVQIYSISKMLGLSGLRIGYVVCKNPKFYSLIQEYMEAMTVGVSIASQSWLHFAFTIMNQNPELVNQFEQSCADTLKHNKKLCLNIDPDVLQVPDNIVDSVGMFGWFKIGAKADFIKSKINLIEGTLFGAPGMCRMNLAWDADQMQEIVERLNHGYHRR